MARRTFWQRPVFEPLEDRRLLAVSAVVDANDVLNVTLSAANDHAFITSSASGIRVGTSPNGTQVLGDVTGIVAITVTDSGSANNQSVDFDGTSAFALNGFAGNLLSSVGVETINVDNAITGTSADLLFRASTVALNAVVDVGSGNVTIEPIALNSSIGIGDGAAGTLNLDTAELTTNLHSTGKVTIGRPGAEGNVDIQPIDLSGEDFDLEIFGDGVSVTGALQLAGAIAIRANDDDTGLELLEMMPGASIETADTSANAVDLSIKFGGAAAENMILRDIGVGDGGTIKVTGANGTVRTVTGTTISAPGSGSILFSTNNNLDIDGALDGGSGLVELKANQDAATGASLDFDGTITTTKSSGDAVRLIANVSTTGTGQGDVTVDGTISSGGGRVLISTRSPAGGSNANVSVGNLVVNTDGGDFEIDANDQLEITGTLEINGGGRLLAKANQDGASLQRFTMASAAEITTDRSAADAVSIVVNTSSGGTGNAEIGNVTLESTGAGIDIHSFAGDMTQISGTTMSAPGNGSITISADGLDIQGMIDADTGTVNIYRSVTGQINLGSFSVFGEINLDQSEISNLSAAALVLGNPTAAANNVTSVTSRAADFTAAISGLVTINPQSTATVTFRGATSANALLVNQANEINFRFDGVAPVITTTADQEYHGNVTLTNNTTFAGVNVTVHDKIDTSAATIIGLNRLTVNASGVTRFGDVIGGTRRLEALTTDAGGRTELGASINTNGASVTFNDAVLLTADVTLDEDGSGDITFGSTVDSAAGNNFSLNVDTAGGATIFAGAVGNDALGSLSDDGGLGSITTDADGTTQVNGGNVVTTGDQTYNDPLSLGATATLSAEDVFFATTVNNGGFILTLDVTGTDGSASGAISGNGGLTKKGSGTFAIEAGNSYSGETTVEAGTLALSHTSNNNIASSNPITVAAGAELDVTMLASTQLDLAAGQTLRGGGTVTGIVRAANDSTVSPGTSPAILAIDGGFLLDSGAELAIEIDGTLAGGQHDQVKVVGQVTLGGDLAITGSHSPMPGDEYILIDNDLADPVIGTFAGLPEGTQLPNFLGSSLTATLTYVGGDGNDVALEIIPANVTINQAAGQDDVVTSGPIRFTAVFSIPVTGFDAASDVDLSSSSADVSAATVTITEVAPMDGTTYEVAVDGMAGTGFVIAEIPANVVDGNGNHPSTSTDNEVGFVENPPTPSPIGQPVVDNFKAGHDGSNQTNGSSFQLNALWRSYTDSGGFNGTTEKFITDQQGGATATYAFEVAPGTSVRVFATWRVNFGSRVATNAPYSVYDGYAGLSAPVTTVHVNQRTSPGGTTMLFTDDRGNDILFQQLASFTPTTDLVSVQLTDEMAGGIVNADAVIVLPGSGLSGGNQPKSEPVQSAWHNKDNPFDVNDDTAVTPQDVLAIVNHLNAGDATPAAALQSGNMYYDVNDNGAFEPLDAVLVINHLNVHQSETLAEAERHAAEPLAPRADRSGHQAVVAAAAVSGLRNTNWLVSQDDRAQRNTPARGSASETFQQVADQVFSEFRLAHEESEWITRGSTHSKSSGIAKNEFEDELTDRFADLTKEVAALMRPQF